MNRHDVEAHSQLGHRRIAVLQEDTLVADNLAVGSLVEGSHSFAGTGCTDQTCC